VRISGEILSRKHEGRPTNRICASRSVARVLVPELTEHLCARHFDLVLTTLGELLSQVPVLHEETEPPRS